MKKIIAVILTLYVAAGFAFAQSEASALPEDEIKVDLTKKTITPKNQHLDPEDKTGKVIIEYTPMVDEVRIHYKYMEKDRERYYKDSRGIKWAEYTAHVKFTR